MFGSTSFLQSSQSSDQLSAERGEIRSKIDDEFMFIAWRVIHNSLLLLNSYRKGHVSDDSSFDSGSTTGSSASSGNSNTATQAYIERQKKATGKSAKDIKSSIECNKCGKKGHIAPDCRSSGGKERKQPRNRSKNTGNRAGSIFASSLQTVDEAVDDDTYDEDQDGFVIDTAGVFCAVISNQYDDLYIDKDDLMPELVSDDDTDSEDESPLHKVMTGLSITELSILPVILDSFDSKQLSYEAVSAELDRYLNGPQPIIVYSTHTRRTGATFATHITLTCCGNSSLPSEDEFTINFRDTSLSTLS